MSCRDALWFATVGAARIMGLEEEIGSLAPGRKADLVLIDLDRPHLQPFYGDYAALVFYARADDVAASVIDGRLVMDERRLLTVDEREVHRALCRHTPTWRQRLVELGALASRG
jgi:5-methylthioadenosine/S-adenosylhomocysteine deaminase